VVGRILVIPEEQIWKVHIANAELTGPQSRIVGFRRSALPG
jgi:hypothetical protein